jgi:hypothetical protein
VIATVLFRPCDALSRNLPKEFQIVVANCIAHGRRKFVEVAAKFPEECHYVLEALGAVYKHDAFCREQGMSPEERLSYHQTHSGPRMKELEQWFQKQFAGRRVEPNSGLGQAITYYKTQNGARVGDLFMSLIYTCHFSDANPFHYLTELQQHGEELSCSPEQWMPWNYRETLMQKSSL